MMFRSARWRLTLWFLGVVALILLVLGLSVFYVTRRAFMDGIDDDLRGRAEREAAPLRARVLDANRRGEALGGVTIGPPFTAGGYFYALVDPRGNLVASTQNLDPAGLPASNDIAKAVNTGPRYVDTTSSTGEDLRIYLLPVGGSRNPFVLQVGRSIEPELSALRRLLFILLGGGGAGLLLALGGGYFLAGRALRPIRMAVDRQRAFVADASHELRTPLALIRANAELVGRHPEQKIADNASALDDIIKETDHLNTIVGQMFTLAMADVEAMPLEFAEVDLSEIVQEAGRQASLLAQGKSISVEVKANGALYVMGDRTRLRELLLILVDNAIKYTGEGGSLGLALAEVGGRAQLRVSDTGQGIAPEALPHIFERFYRADKARAREAGSAGLGLAIASWIVEKHRGNIRVESEPDKGSTFIIEL
ncbi:MAG TPA: ATP-binding protein, partial [Dehalococcoidia bacterium]|nr:ATP-binding protein [Dehalococcoidia bacterium]